MPPKEGEFSVAVVKPRRESLPHLQDKQPGCMHLPVTQCVMEVEGRRHRGPQQPQRAWPHRRLLPQNSRRQP